MISAVLEQEGKIELIEVGTQVVFIDDKIGDIQPIGDAFNSLNVSNQCFVADEVEPKYPAHPLEDVKLVFLDLFYNENFGVDFNSYACADWLIHLVPENKSYILVIWSRDIERTDELLTTLKEIGAPYPTTVKRKSKPEYLKGNVENNVNKMLLELGINLKELEVQEFYGKVIDLEKDAVLINCLINEEPKVFEVRRFDLKPFNDYMALENGKFLRIKITTKPGSRTIDFNSEEQDLSEKFIKPDVDVIDDSGTIDWLNITE